MVAKIITFYSYKGGVGRSMALANVAWILASSGKKVLAIDWDLEAPGLHQYFRPFLLDKDLASTDGLIDFVLEYAVAAMTPATLDEAAPTGDWYKSYANILRYAVSLNWDFAYGGGLDFVGAGRQGGAYASNVNAFNWQSFYERLGGGSFFEEVKNRMRSEYDYVLIDSRTGIGDTAGICTVHLPDVLVVCFSLNRQSIEGSAVVVESVRQQREKETGSELSVFPVPMRLEYAEREMLVRAREFAKQSFNLYPTQMTAPEREGYWSQMHFAYVPFYAYSEALAVFAEHPSDPKSLLASAQRLTAYLTHGEVSQLSPIAEETRLRVLGKYELRTD